MGYLTTLTMITATATTTTTMAWPSNQTLPAQSVEEVAAKMQEKVRVSGSGRGGGVWRLGGRQVEFVEWLR